MSAGPQRRRRAATESERRRDRDRRGHARGRRHGATANRARQPERASRPRRRLRIGLDGGQAAGMRSSGPHRGDPERDFDRRPAYRVCGDQRGGPRADAVRRRGPRRLRTLREPPVRRGDRDSDHVERHRQRRLPGRRGRKRDRVSPRRRLPVRVRPPDVCEGLLSADSHGRYCPEHVRGQYRDRRLR